MALFLILCVPIALVIVIGLYFQKEKGRPAFFLHGLHGFLLAVPALLINVILQGDFPKTFLFKDIFLYVLLHKTFQLFIFSLFMFHLPCGFRLGKRTEKYTSSLEWQSLLFFGAFYTAASWLDGVLLFGNYHPAVLFYLPLVRLGIIFASAALLAYIETETGIKKALLYTGTLFIPILASLGYPLFYLEMYSVAVPLLIIIVGGPAALLHVRMRREYSP